MALAPCPSVRLRLSGARGDAGVVVILLLLAAHHQPPVSRYTLLQDPPGSAPPTRTKPGEGERDEDGKLIFFDAPDFRPSLTPRECLERGCFGGCYFNPRGGKVGPSFSCACFVLSLNPLPGVCTGGHFWPGGGHRCWSSHLNGSKVSL